mmetsp:Transcript_108342/g.345492  ORF Transcript_108342/g.345492 Transcript_108342/m.345492 type:complete len:608 (-) Transcript_108342:233-2056(-)
MRFEAARRGRAPVSEATLPLQIKAAATRRAWAEALSLTGALVGCESRDALRGFTGAISACVAGQQWGWALQLLPVQRAAACDSDVVSCSALIASFCPEGRWLQATMLLSEMRRCRLVPNERSYASAISACERGQSWPRALDLLADMCLRRVFPNSFCHNAAVSAMEKGGQWMRAMGQLRTAGLGRVESDVITHSALISACEKGGHWDWALLACREMALRALQPNVVSLSAAISSCCGSEPQWARASSLLGEMRRLRTVPSIVSYNAAMHASERAGQTARAMELLDLAVRAGLRPSLVSYGSALRACGLRSDWLESLRLWDDIRDGSPPPDISICSFAVDACDGAGGPRTQSVQLLSDLRGLCWRSFSPGKLQHGGGARAKSEIYQVYEGIDVLWTHGLLDEASQLGLGRAVASRVLERLRSLQGGGGSTEHPTGWRLNEPVLEQQPSLGLVLTRHALKELAMVSPEKALQLPQADPPWCCQARLTSARSTGSGSGGASGSGRGSSSLPGGPMESGTETAIEDMTSQVIAAWISYLMTPVSASQVARGRDRHALPLQSRSRTLSFGAASGDDLRDGNSWLVPVFREHDRSHHAERCALLAVLQVAACL